MKYDNKFSALDKITNNAARAGSHVFKNFYEYKNREEPIDILIIGSSTAYRSFDPRVFSNYGINCIICNKG